jgi:predicted Fe-Mo cluster-binding NifX family protein
MKIAISSTGPGLDAEVDSRFGRCSYFVIVESDTMQFETLDNSGATADGGAGISTGQVIASKGVQVVLTGSCGPNAYQVLSAAGIQVITGVTGTIRDAVKEYKSGSLQNVSQTTEGAHLGMRKGRGKGSGMGMGKRRGREEGIKPMVTPQTQSTSPQQELGGMKAQAQMLFQQLTELQRRIEELEMRVK